MSSPKPFVELEDSQIKMVGLAGIFRHLEFIARDAKPRFGKKKATEWQEQIEGALSEYALAKFLDKHWDGVGKPNGDDLQDEEIRVTDYHKGHLLLHKEDKDEKRYWLLTGENGKYYIHGFIYAINGKQDKYWKKIIEKDGRDRSCYWIPQEDLESPFMVDDYKKSEAWRLETEAREILKWSLNDRRKHLSLVYEKRGDTAGFKLQEEITRLWKIQKNPQTKQDDLSTKNQ